MTKPQDASADRQPTFEESLARLETIVHELEEGQVGLSRALACYEEGIGLLRECHALLERAERRIELLTGVDDEGRPVTEPVADESSFDAAESADWDQARPRTRRPRTAARPVRRDASKTSGNVDESQ